MNDPTIRQAVVFPACVRRIGQSTADITMTQRTDFHLTLPVSNVDHTLGPDHAPVTLVEYLDPACGACAAFSPVVKQIQLLYPTEVRVVVRYATFHRGSDQAVRLLEAARRQGKFEPVLDALFERQAEWASPEAPNIPRIGQIATELGVNIEKARRDAALPEVTEVLRQDAEDLVALKVDRTPSFFVNGKPLVDFGAEQLLDLVRQEVVRAKG